MTRVTFYGKRRKRGVKLCRIAIQTLRLSLGRMRRFYYVTHFHSFASRIRTSQARASVLLASNLKRAPVQPSGDLTFRNGTRLFHPLPSAKDFRAGYVLRLFSGTPSVSYPALSPSLFPPISTQLSTQKFR